MRETALLHFEQVEPERADVVGFGGWLGAGLANAVPLDCELVALGLGAWLA